MPVRLGKDTAKGQEHTSDRGLLQPGFMQPCNLWVWAVCPRRRGLRGPRERPKIRDARGMSPGAWAVQCQMVEPVDHPHKRMEP